MSTSVSVVRRRRKAATPPQPEGNLRLGTIFDVIQEHPAFTEPALRALIFRAKENGLAEHIYRVGRRVLIDLNGFPVWIRGK